MIFFALPLFFVILLFVAMLYIDDGREKGRRILWLSNPGVAVIAVSLVIVALAYPIGSSLYEWGECNDGFKNPASCKNLSRGLGTWAFAMQFYSVVFYIIIGWPIALLATYAEAKTRRRMSQTAN